MSELTKERVKYLKSLPWEQLKAMGYRMVSRKYGCIARIDSPRWREKTNDENQYRRVHSKDSVDVGFYKANKCGTSEWDKVGFIKLENKVIPTTHKE